MASPRGATAPKKGTYLLEVRGLRSERSDIWDIRDLNRPMKSLLWIYPYNWLIIQHPALAPACPVVRLSSSPPRPRSSVPTFCFISLQCIIISFTFMDNKSSTNHTCVTAELDKMILNSDHCNFRLAGDNIAKATNMSIFCPRSSMILTKGIVVTSCCNTVVR